MKRYGFEIKIAAVILLFGVIVPLALASWTNVTPPTQYHCGRRLVTVTVASAATNAETQVPALNCEVTQIHFETPDLDDTDTAELKIQDEVDNNIFTSGELAENTSAPAHVLQVLRTLVGDMTFRVECQGQQAAERAFHIYYYYR